MVAERLVQTFQRPISGLALEIQKEARTMDVSNELPTVDFGIVTALPIELDACLRHLGDVSKATFEQGDSRTYYRGNVSIANNYTYQIMATLLPRIGNVEAALATNDLIHLWRPRCVLMVGIAGGISPSNQALGDVVVSEGIFYYETAKISQRDEPRPRVLPADAVLYGRALNLRSPEWSTGIPRDIQRPSELDRLPAVHFGPITSRHR